MDLYSSIKRELLQDGRGCGAQIHITESCRRLQPVEEMLQVTRIAKPGARELGAAGIVKVELGELGKLLENFAESALVFSVNLFAVV